MLSPQPKIKLVFERERHVECLDFSIVLDVFNAKTISAHGLGQLCGTTQILFVGYENDARLPFAIPELRAFLRALDQAWPFAPFFCDLDNSFVSLAAFARVDHACIIERAGSDEVSFCISTKELRRYVTQSHHVIEDLGKIAGMSRTQIRRRQAQFDDYIVVSFGSFWKARPAL